MNPFEMVIGIVLIVTIGKILSARLGVNPRLSKRDGKWQGRTLMADPDGVSAVESDRMKAEITRLNERLAVLERIATDPARRLSDEIESLKRD
jgi:hypothetical protein